MLFQTPKYNENTAELTVSPTEAEQIYKLFRAGYEPTEIFTNFGHKIKRSVIVRNEYLALEEEILTKARGQYTTEEVITESTSEDGAPVLTTEVISTTHTYNTKEELLASLTESTTLLSNIIADVVNDVIIYNPSYNPSRTWEQFLDEI